jgi:hypothetical protein
MTQLGVNIPALTAASGVLATLAAEFGQARVRVAAYGEPLGATAEATGLLARGLAAVAGSLTRAQSEVQQVADHLGATADAYARTEQALSRWNVPGLGQGGGAGW